MADNDTDFSSFVSADPAENDTDFSTFTEADLSESTQEASASGFSGFAPERIGPTLGEQAGAALEAGGRSALQGAGALAGAGIGAAVSGPFAPIGAVAGAIGGYWVGGKSAEMTGLRSAEQLPPELRPAGYFGESLGGALPFATAPYALAAANYRFAPTTVGNFMNQIVNTAKTRPVQFGIVEAGPAISAAGGAALAESVAPGETGIRISAEVAGGLLNPTRLISASLSGSAAITKRVMQSVSPAARETEAMRQLNTLFAATGEDPALIARVLRDSLVTSPEQLTVGQRTGSVALSSMEQWLTKKNPKFGAETKALYEEGLNSIRTQIALLRGSGDPEALKGAAEMQAMYYRTLIQGRLDSALDDARIAAAGITQDTPAARAELSTKVRGLVDEAITSARTAERELWAAVPKDVQAPVTNLQREYDTVVADLLPEVRDKRSPKIVRDFIKRISKPEATQESLIILPEDIGRRVTSTGPVTTTTGELTALRSELLEMARESSTSGDYRQARIYSNLAEAVLDDVDSAFRATSNQTYQEARQFSKELNDTFTRSFVGKVTAQGRYGDRVAPELLMRRATASGAEATRLQLEEIEEATRFVVDRGFGDPDAIANMMDAQQRIIRLNAAEAIDPATGQVSVKRLSKFLNDNEALMNRFPEIRRDLERALISQDARKRMEALAKGQQDLIVKQKAVGKLAAGDPILMSRQALLSNNAPERLSQMAKIAKRGGVDPTTGARIESSEAVAGLRSSVLDAAFQLSTPRGGELNIDTARNFLFNPSTPGQKSPMQALLDDGVIDQDHFNNMRQFFDAAERIQMSTRAGTALDEQINLTDAAIVTIARGIGSKIAGGIAGATGASAQSLVIHGAGARFAETVMTKIPSLRTQQVMIDLMNDPERLATLLEKAPTPKAAAEQARQINAWLIQSGFIGVESLLDIPVEPIPMQQ